MTNSDIKTAEDNKVIHVGTLEHSSLNILDDIIKEFWKQKPGNEVRTYKNEKKCYFSVTYLFKTEEDSQCFRYLLRQNNINFITAPESKYDKLATSGMTFTEMRTYLSTKNAF